MSPACSTANHGHDATRTRGAVSRTGGGEPHTGSVEPPAVAGVSSVPRPVFGG